MPRQHAPSAERNRQPLLEVLRPRMQGPVLELASGTGQHARWFSEATGLDWQPTDVDPQALESIAAWREGGPSTLRAPRRLDVCGEWPSETYGSVLAVNLVHISPWPTTRALFAGSAEVLAPGGRVFLYGPYRLNGQHTSDSNLAFDVWLKERDPAYGVRDLADVEAVANANGLRLDERIPMPANNFVLVFTHAP